MRRNFKGMNENIKLQAQKKIWARVQSNSFRLFWEYMNFEIGRQKNVLPGKSTHKESEVIVSTCVIVYEQQTVQWG